MARRDVRCIVVVWVGIAQINCDRAWKQKQKKSVDANWIIAIATIACCQLIFFNTRQGSTFFSKTQANVLNKICKHQIHNKYNVYERERIGYLKLNWPHYLEPAESIKDLWIILNILFSCSNNSIAHHLMIVFPIPYKHSNNAH